MDSFTEMFQKADSAFNMFFDEDVVVELKGGQRIPTKACITTDNTLDPISEEMMDTESQGITLAFRREDWPLLGSIKRGDKITRTLWNGQPKTYAVQEVKEDFALGFIVRAREV